MSEQKASKKKVNYRKARGERNCGNCWMFQPKNYACMVVAGIIDRADVCDWHEYPHEKRKAA